MLKKEKQNLDSLSEKWGSDKHFHGFTKFYEGFFVNYKNSKKICEIGMGGIMWQRGGKLPGASSRMWLEYFPDAHVFILDNFSEIKEEEKEIVQKLISENKDRLTLILGDQAKRSDLNMLIDKTGSDIDILVDDGGHSMDQQQISLGFLFSYLKPGGLYVIEDLHTSIPPSRPRFKLAKDLSNSTLKMIEKFNKTKKIQSRYLSQNEEEYLEKNIEYCKLFKNPNGNGITCILKKVG
tara:strand:- start:100 stop:810 length:711 start_codon:yes stop_codon:yes gene_type:complete